MIPSFLTVCFFACSAITGTRVARLFGGTEGNFWRLCVATTALALFAHTFGKGLSGPGFPILLISGIIGFGVGDIALFHGYQRIGSRLTILLVQCLAAPFAAMTEWIWLKNRMTLAEIFWGLLILCGVGLALSPDKKLNLTRKTIVPGILLGVVAAYCQGFGAVLSRHADEISKAASHPLDGITTAYQRIIGGVLVTGIFLLFVKRRHLVSPGSISHPAEGKSAIWKKGWWLVVLNGLAGPTFGVSCYQWALSQERTGVVLPIVALTPLAVMPLSLYFAKEKPYLHSIIGGVIAVAGAIGLTQVAMGR